MTRIKICGLTREVDVKSVCQQGADALGLVFYPPSPRHVTVAQAAKLVRVVSPFVSIVGLFVNPSAAQVQAVLTEVSLDILQFHGDETPEFCRQFGKPYLKAVRVKTGVDLLQYATQFSDAQGLLLDAFIEGTPGGTGEAFDWALIPPQLPLPIILSGGLQANNVTQAIRQVKPYAVDVSSGVEFAKGIKDIFKIIQFIQEVRQIDLQLSR